MDKRAPGFMDTIVSLCKRRGFVFQASEIYGGIGNTYDYGPLGVELKRRVKEAWWNRMVTSRDDIVGLDSAIIQNPKVWETSGHVGGFSDPMVDCKKCKGRFRADKLDEASCLERPSKHPGECDGELTEARAFNLMFKTSIGPVESTGSVAYLRPETAQGIFLNFKNVLESSRLKPPFGIAQIGKSFRNEITPGNFVFRTREFEQAEMEFFVPPPENDKWFAYWRNERRSWYEDYGIDPDRLRLRDHDKTELAHYSTGCTDVEYEYPFGWGELEGIACRTDFDLRRHSEASGVELKYFDPDTKERYFPYVIEPAAGLTRGLLAVLCEAYTVDESRPSPELMRFHPRLAPIKCGVFPLVNKEGMPEIAEKLYRDVRKRVGPAQYDAKQSIGKRYARMDEAGTPFCVTIDGQSIDEQTVTVRDRDTGNQLRVAIEQVVDYLKERVG